ncbi:hypothetical protein SESBI_13419 [Sesbania bispinosa]|nr:hypothetical protein SESBI_13419 [Sesbania bispinosa]
MAGGLLGDNIGLKEELIKKACAFAFKAHNYYDTFYLVNYFDLSKETIKICRSNPSTPNVSSEFYSTVMRNAATVTSHAACTLMGSTNLLLETVTNFVDLSPYRPFGTYIFCNGHGQLIVIKNSDAVLQLMFHTAQLSNLDELSVVANNSILQHHVYETELEESLGMQDVVYLYKLDDLPLSVDGSNTTISTALDGLGLSTRARLCLRAAGELEKQKSINEEKIKKEIHDKARPSMEEMESYKRTCEIQKGYYDAFKYKRKPRTSKQM